MTNSKPATDQAPRRTKYGYYPIPVGTTLPDGTVLSEVVNCMSVTTIMNNGVPKPALQHWAAREVAKCAINNVPRLVKARGQTAREEAFEWLRCAAEHNRDAAADLGSAVHDVIEAEVLDRPHGDVTDEQRPFVDAFARFVADHRPVWEATEMVLANVADRWAGKGDAWARLPRLGDGVTLIDWKTSRGVYGDNALQVAAYARAQLAWTKDGQQVTPPAPARAVIVHLRPDKYPERGYAVYPADISDTTYRSFLAVRDVALGWVKGASETALGEALPYPAAAEAVA